MSEAAFEVYAYEKQPVKITTTASTMPRYKFDLSDLSVWMP